MDMTGGRQHLIGLIRQISLARMIQHGNLRDVKVSELEKIPSIFSHWMAIILIMGSKMNIVFKVHFKTLEAQSLASPAYGVPPEKVTGDQAIDFMREFCNLTAGGIKAALLTYGFNLSISLPIVTRGFDEIFFNRNMGQESFSDYWYLNAVGFKIPCTITTDLFEDVDLSTIDSNFDGNREGDSEVEFL